MMAASDGVSAAPEQGIRWREGLTRLRPALGAQIGFAVAFQLLAAIVLFPVGALLSTALMGRPVLDSTEVASFVLSPRGLVSMILLGTAWLGIYLVQLSGLTAIAEGALAGRPLGAREAARLVLGRALGLTKLALRFVLTGLCVLAPVALVAGLFARQLLPRHDINFYLLNKPPEFLTALAVTGVVALCALGVAVWIILRWQLAVPVLVGEGIGASAACRRSTDLWLRGRGTCVLIAIVLAITPVLLAFAGALVTRGLAAAMLSVTKERLGGLAAAFGALIVLDGAILACAAIAESIVRADALALLHEAMRARGGEGPIAPPAVTDSDVEKAPAGFALSARAITALGASVLVAAGVLGSVLLAGPLSRTIPLAITAHRGDHTHEPENTAASVRQAIAEGADWAEIDVQEIKDGTVIVAHDADLSRLGGPTTKIWDYSTETLAPVRIRNPKDPSAAPEPVPTLQQILDLTKNRIRLIVELKYYGHDQALAAKVVQMIRADSMLGQVAIHSLEYRGLQEVRHLEPSLPIGYIMSFNAKRPERLDLDFYSVQQGRVDARFIRQAHRRGRGVYVWTVNDSVEMHQVAALGVDNIITDDPAAGIAVKREHDALSAPELALARVRAWLAQ